MEKVSALQWLNDQFESEVLIPATEIRRRSDEAGIPWRNVQRAKKRLRVASIRDGIHGVWMWWGAAERMYRTTVEVSVLAEGREEIDRLLTGYLESCSFITQATVTHSEVDPDRNYFDGMSEKRQRKAS